jgi:hypothetical protein
VRRAAAGTSASRPKAVRPADEKKPGPTHRRTPEAGKANRAAAGGRPAQLAPAVLLAFALRFSGPSASMNADEIMAEIFAKAERLRARRPRRSRDVTCVTAPQREIVYR